MIAWVFGVPLILMVMVLALDVLEARVVAPAERGATLSKIVETETPEEAERHVAVLLAPTIERRVRTARAS